MVKSPQQFRAMFGALAAAVILTASYCLAVAVSSTKAQDNPTATSIPSTAAATAAATTSAPAQNVPPTDRPFPGVAQTDVATSAAPAQNVPPTDRPFPGVAQTDVATSAAPAQNVPPTDRPFPGAVQTAASTSAATKASNATQSATQTPTLTINDIMSTSVAAQSQLDQLRTDNKALQDSLTAAQADKGASMYALAIVAIGVVLALGVFFGLGRSRGK